MSIDTRVVAGSTGPQVDLTELGPWLDPLADALRRRQWRLTTAESCTGGLIAAACTVLPGSSDWYDRGFVTYSNEAKTELLGVAPDLVSLHGAVSEPVAEAMVRGALQRSRAQLAVAVTGVAGPGGGTPAKPVGLVWMAVATMAPGASPAAAPQVQTFCDHHPGGRAAVRGATVQRALERLLAASLASQASS
jgi:nicotinamide-nucleotide amidase